MQECNFSANEIDIIVDDAIEFHGCKNSELPKTLEGKIMATADALAHLKSNFYDYALEQFSKVDSVGDIKIGRCLRLNVIIGPKSSLMKSVKRPRAIMKGLKLCFKG